MATFLSDNKKVGCAKAEKARVKGVWSRIIEKSKEADQHATWEEFHLENLSARRVKRHRYVVHGTDELVNHVLKKESPEVDNSAVVFRRKSLAQVAAVQDADDEDDDNDGATFTRGEWVEDEAIVKFQTTAFNAGAMRECYRMKKLSQQPNRGFHALNWRQANNYVIKRYKDPNEPPETYFNDVRMQMEAAYWASLFNLMNPPRKIDMLQCYVIELADEQGEGSPTYYGVERFIEGEYVKHNSNAGFVDEGHHRNTPQAFSHFTFQRSCGDIMVVDIQGVNDLYTDPAMLSRDQRFGASDLGVRGMASFFATHICNPICEELGLRPFRLYHSEALRNYRTLGTSFVLQRATVVRRRHDIDEMRQSFIAPLVVRGGTGRYLGDTDVAAEDDNYISAALTRQGTGITLGEDEEEAGEGHEQKFTFEQLRSHMNKRGSTYNEPFDDKDERLELTADLHLALVRLILEGRFDAASSSDTPDSEACLYHLHKAAKGGNVEATVCLARLYSGFAGDDPLLPNDVRNLVQEDKDFARKLWVIAANEGSIAALSRVARAHHKGDGTDVGISGLEEDAQKALNLYLQLIEKGGNQRFAEESSLPLYEAMAEAAEIYYALGKTEEARAMYESASEAAMASHKMQSANKYIMKAEECY